MGVYQDSKTASQLFPLMAQKYLVAETSGAIAELDEELHALGEKLSK